MARTKKTLEQLFEDARDHINRESDLVTQICVDHNQIYDNVKSTHWFTEMVMLKLRELHPRTYETQ